MPRVTLLTLLAGLTAACAQSGTPVGVQASPSASFDPPSQAPVVVRTTLPVPGLSQPAATTAAPAAGSGPYTFPIQPASGVTYARSHHDYPATDMFAPCGRPAVSPVAGRVDEVTLVDTWRKPPDDGATRGGLSVSVVGDDGVRYYGSHLRAVAYGIEPGVRVSAGQQLGEVGNTGSARGTACHLHFGISPPRGPGDWEVRRGVVYPWPYLDSWRSGGQQSPAPAVATWSAAHP